MAKHDEHTGHSHAPKDFGLAFAVGAGLNIVFVLVEATYGFLANSTALFADAGHNLSDVLGLLVAWGASALVRQAPTSRYTYGLRSTTILAALANAIFLLVAIGAIAWEAVGRFSRPDGRYRRRCPLVPTDDVHLFRTMASGRVGGSVGCIS